MCFKKYSKGEMMTGEIKALAIQTITPLLVELQEKRKKITDAVVEEFMTIRKLSAFTY